MENVATKISKHIVGLIFANDNSIDIVKEINNPNIEAGIQITTVEGYKNGDWFIGALTQDFLYFKEEYYELLFSDRYNNPYSLRPITDTEKLIYLNFIMKKFEFGDY